MVCTIDFCNRVKFDQIEKITNILLELLCNSIFRLILLDLDYIVLKHCVFAFRIFEIIYITERLRYGELLIYKWLNFNKS